MRCRPIRTTRRILRPSATGPGTNCEPHADRPVRRRGARGRETEVMAELLAGTVSADRLHLDTISQDTLATVRAARRFYRAGGFDRLLAATDTYHQPRVRMLFALYGIRARPIP